MENFWDYSVWGIVLLFALLLVALLVGNVLRRTIPFLKKSLIPTSVIGGALLLAIAAIYKAISGRVLFDEPIFGENGSAALEVITYHALALGFIATALRSSEKKLNKKRTSEIFNTGVTTVSTYLLQGVLGLGITIVAGLILSGFFSAAGLLLPFGYGQGTGQALNYGNIYETTYGFAGGKTFGLTVAALGFISAAVGGVLHLNVHRKRLKRSAEDAAVRIRGEEIQSEDEIPMQESIDKMTIQIALIAFSYLLAYLLMWGLGSLLPNMRAVIYGFNFLLGVLAATLVKAVMKLMRKKSVIKKEYTNNFLLTRAGNFFFDVMVVAGVAAIRLDLLENYWGVLLILGISGALVTYIYNRIVAKKLFPGYAEEQFLMMYGMLTGTASTGVILLREIDGDFETPASENMVYQNFPAIVFGFPLMFLATLAPDRPLLTLGILAAFFVLLNIILFRSFIFKKRKKKE